MLFVFFVLVSILATDAQQWAMPVMPQTQQFQMPQQQQQMGGCYDTAINCLENSYFCTQPYYESTMRSQCARTCQFCREENNFDFSGNNCRDVNPECRIWAERGFCGSAFYPEHVKRRYCAFSCNYCRPQQSSQPTEEEQAPEQPFADDPTSKEHTKKHHRKTTTTAPTKDKDEEEIVSTTSEPVEVTKSEEKQPKRKTKKFKEEKEKEED
ncbi:hypothetical protein M3Y97_01122500 [Aphelenchoides bicaudatus]|nr:hypothetical protein M3Y97_01122500 [Aphelenchoides bicaudatus]